MAIESATKRMTSAEVVALNRAHTFFECVFHHFYGAFHAKTESVFFS